MAVRQMEHLYHVRVQPSRGWAGVDVRELWEFRDLWLILAMRDVQLRYKQTVLGVIWVVLQPLLSSLIFLVIFGRIANLPSDGLPYLLFVYAGILPWNLFSGALQRAGSSLISDAKLISKVYFPRMIIPLASTAAVLVDFGVGLSVISMLLLAYQMPLTPNLLALPILLLIAVMIASGVGLLVSAFNVYYRDFMYALPFVIQVWMYSSPLVYSTRMIPDQWQWLYALNPMVGVIDGFRWSLLGQTGFPWLSLSVAVVVGSLFFLSGAFVFKRVERRFVDVI